MHAIGTSLYYNLHKLSQYREISFTKWDQFTTDIILAASKVLIDGRPIRAYFDKCLSKIINDLVSQSDEVEQAFKSRVQEYLAVIEKLSKQRDEVCVKC